MKALAVELLLRCVKLTPRLAMLLGRTMTGGLLGHCELTREEREIELRFAAEDLSAGELFFDRLPDMLELRCFEFLSVWILSELP